MDGQTWNARRGEWTQVHHQTPPDTTRHHQSPPVTTSHTGPIPSGIQKPKAHPRHHQSPSLTQGRSPLTPDLDKSIKKIFSHRYMHVSGQLGAMLREGPSSSSSRHRRRALIFVFVPHPRAENTAPSARSKCIHLSTYCASPLYHRPYQNPAHSPRHPLALHQR